MRWVSRALTLGVALGTGARAWVPATPSNSTDPASIQAGPNANGPSALSTLFYPNIASNYTVSYEFAAPFTNGVREGALLLYDEQQALAPASVMDQMQGSRLAPWIALISCDSEGNSSSGDIFSSAHLRGAHAALLYSNTSDDCILDPNYRASGPPALDIYSMTGINSSRALISALVSNAQYTTYNATPLYEIWSNVVAAENKTLAGAQIVFAQLTAANATAGSDNNTSGGPGIPPPAPKHAAMLVLYVITGIVCGLFSLIIVSGFVRAMRNPDRYGPRSGRHGDGDGAAPQSRAQGLSRAILDTFTIVKFTAPPADSSADVGTHDGGKSDLEAGRPSSIDKAPFEFIELPTLAVHKPGEDGAYNDEDREETSPTSATHETASASSSPVSPRNEREDSPRAGPSSPTTPRPTPRPPPARPASEAYPPVLPDAIGRETCPICIVDFEDDDELRVLPCVGQHRFHRACVDQWLLELSASCPLCRHDFHALETLIAGEERPPMSPRASQGRFSRYVRLARRHRRGEHGHGERRSAYEMDPTDPPLPTVPATAL